MSVSGTLSESAFQQQLAFGQMAETAIAKWLIAQGRIILPVYDVEVNTGKGPRVFGARFEAAAPDLLVFRGGGSFTWCEAKHKTRFAWYRLKRRWQTGIDLNHWDHYQKVGQATGFGVYLFFLHDCSTPSASDLQYGCDPECPTGLFGNTLDNLAGSISQTSERHGRHGMVYWAREALNKVASLDEVFAAAEARSDRASSWH